MKNKANEKKNQTKMDPQMIKMIESDRRNKRHEKETIMRIYFKNYGPKLDWLNVMYYPQEIKNKCILTH